MSRIDSLRKQLPKLKADAFLCTTRSNVRYLTGFTGSAGVALITGDDAWFVSDFRYKTQSAEQVRDARIVISATGQSLLAAVASLVNRTKLSAIAFESSNLTVDALKDAQKKFKRAKLVPAGTVVETLRMVKDENEIAAIRNAVAITDRAYEHILGRIKAGRTEKSIAFELERYMLMHGADTLAFESIVVSGARSALPHGRASEKKIEKGDLVTLDFGARYQGYCSDCTRTVCVGKPTSEQQKIYTLVRDAQQLAEARIRAGENCRGVDKLARDLIAAAGHRDHFGHGLGHSLGLDIHESPRFAKTAKGKLKANMAMTVEPGVYVEGWGGVRIEDLVIVKDDGIEVLTRAPNPVKVPVV